MFQLTSKEAYEEMIRTNKIGKRQEQICRVLSEFPFPMTNLEISHFSGLPINSVTPRVKELREKGVIAEAFRKVDPATGRRAIAWKLI